ncbi:hypothetical protein ACODTP_17780 [Acinetobacter pittii]|uniref:hypothetical protein n=1 Tax=Acinetobacter pittii TaxID=48296 RepID=UPI003B42F970
MKQEDYLLSCFLFSIGFVILLAKSIATSDQDKWIIILSKAVLNGFTGLFAGAILIWASVPTIAVIALAAILGTLGSEVVIKWIKNGINNNIESRKRMKK